MARLGAIADGISRDLDHALAVMQAHDLEYAELQYVGPREVGDLDETQIESVAACLQRRHCRVSCISRHVFSGLPVDGTDLDSPALRGQLDGLARCIAMAQRLRAPRVRIMSFRKEMILFGDQGAEEWVVATGAWNRLLTLMEPAVQMAEDSRQTLVVETGNTGMVCSAALARKLIDDLGHPERLKALWDPCNCLYAGEPAFPDGYSQLADGYLGHIHVKDAVMAPALARFSSRPLGEGAMAPYLSDLAAALRRDGYADAISLESIYRPADGSFESGFLRSVETFRTLFGQS